MYHLINNVLMGLNRIGGVFYDYAAGIFIQSALLVILLFVIDLLLRKKVRAIFRYCVWLLVLVKLILPPMLSLPTGIGYWVGDHIPAASNRAFDAVALEHAGPSGEMPQVRHDENIAGVDPANYRTGGSRTAPTWQAVVFLLWLAGVSAFLAVLVQRIRFVKGLVAASCPAGDELTDLLEDCRQQMTVRRDIKLRISEAVPSPAVCGLLRPAVLMPTSLVEKLSPEGLRATLIHELAHIKRGDLWVNSVQTFLQVVYFYNPFVWFANSMIRKVCEEAVDETVLVALGGQAKDYSNTLIDIGEMVFWKADLGLRLIGVAESKKALQWRIRHMLNRPIPKSSKLGAIGIAMLLVIAALLLPMAKAQKPGEGSEPTATENEEKPTKSLHQAAIDGDIEQVKLLISKGADVNERKRNGWTPLHTASYYGRKGVADALIAEGANINATDVSGKTPLHLAEHCGSTYVPESLVAKGAKVNARDNSGNTPLHYAARRMEVQKDLLELLLAKGADIDARNNQDQTPLHYAAPRDTHRKRLTTAAEFLLAHGANVNTKDNAGCTPLYVSARNDRKEIVELLLSKGALINEKANNGMTALHIATMAGYMDVVGLLLHEKADVHSTQSSGWTALHYAARTGNDNIVELLISKGAGVDAKNVRGETPAHLAVVQNHKDTVKLLISKGAEVSTIQMAAYMGDLAKAKSFIENGVSVNAEDGYGLTPLHAAAATGQKDVAEFLVNKGARVSADAGTEGPGTPLHYAIDGGSKEVAELLVNKGAIVNAKNRDGETPLHLTARAGYEGLVRLLLARGADVNAKDEDGETPLHFAAENGHKEVAAFLIDKGADVNAQTNSKRSPFQCAALNGHKDVAELLIDKGADVKPRLQGLLHDVCWAGHKEVAELLIQKGAPINRQETYYWTASHAAVFKGHTDVLELLLAYGADVNAKDSWAWSLLHYASDSADITKLLLSKGADPNVKENERGQTPLHLAAGGRHEGRDYKTVAELLISRGADVNAKDWDGKTPLSLAQEQGHTEIIELLKKHGAKE